MSIIAEEKISNLKNFIDSHDNFYIIGHKEPDGDCISSSLGIAEILKKFNKKMRLRLIFLHFFLNFPYFS